MIRKVLTSLIKPKPALQAALNKHLFSDSPKPDPKQNPEKKTLQSPSEPKQQHLQHEDQDKEEEVVYEKQNRNTTGWWIYRFFFWGTTFTLAYNTYLVAHHDKKTPVENESGAIPYFIDAAKWIHNEYHQKIRFFTEPPLKKLLPNSIHPAMQAKTLVLNLSGTILKTDFVFGKGLVVKKRPGLNNLLRKLVQKYELVIFTDDESMFVDSMRETLDPRQNTFMGCFGRESMVWLNGRYIKDLSYLNRDPRQIIVIEKDIKNLPNHSQNAIVLKEYDGDDNDMELVKLLPLLEALADPSIRDVRKELAKLGENPHITYYEKVQQKKKIFEKKQSGVIGGLFGGRPVQNQSQRSY